MAGQQFYEQSGTELTRLNRWRHDSQSEEPQVIVKTGSFVGVRDCP